MFAIVKASAAKGMSHRDDFPEPRPPGPGEVLIATAKGGVCGTDYHIYSWDAWSASRIKPPLVIGHEFMGRIVALGEGVTHLKVGQRVSAEGHIVCGHCHQCRTGNGHVCQNTRIIGVDRDGAFTEKFMMPAGNCWPIPDTISDDHASIFDPIGNAMHTVSTVGVAGEDVLVVGAGPIGLFSAAIARSSGARTVTVTESHPFRAGIAQKIGVDKIVDPAASDADAQIRTVTGPSGPSVVLEMSGNPDAIRGALAVARPGARFGLLGIPPEPMTIDLGGMVSMKGITLYGIAGRRMYQTWYQTEAFILKNPDLVDLVITHRIPAREYAKAFELLEKREAVKIVLDFTQV